MPTETEVLQGLKDGIAELQKAYLMAFSGESGKLVLADLARFCRADEPCWMPDHRWHALLEGRREVWLRINHQRNLTVEELMQRRLGDSYTVAKIEPEDNDNG